MGLGATLRAWYPIDSHAHHDQIRALNHQSRIRIFRDIMQKATGDRHSISFSFARIPAAIGWMI